MVAEALGRGDDLAARRVMRMGLWASVAYGVPMTLPLLAGEPLLRLLGQPAEIAALGGDYLGIVAWGLVPALLAFVLRSHLAAYERTRIVLLATLAAVTVNAALNWVLIFGRLGFPEMGVKGAATASVAVQVVTVATLALYAMRRLPGPPPFERLWRPDPEVLARVVRLGWPIGITTLAEVSLFAGGAVMMGWLGAVPLAAHGIAIQLAGLAFMVHLGLSQAATVRAGAAFGRGDRTHLARGAQVVVAMSCVVAVATAALFVAAPEPLVALFVADDEPRRDAILATGAVLLVVAGVFQIGDAAQVMALGLLRGVQDTAVPMAIAVVSYLGIGLPAGYALGFPLGLGPLGVWWGLVIGLGVAAALLMLRFWGYVLPRAERPAPA
jgi:MATE family multidrug resistance protein